MQAPHIKIFLTKAKLHVFYYVGIKYLKYVVNFIAFTIEPLTSGHFILKDAGGTKSL
jgi:hypothetical protein